MIIQEFSADLGVVEVPQIVGGEFLLCGGCPTNSGGCCCLEGVLDHPGLLCGGCPTNSGELLFSRGGAGLSWST